MRAVKLLVSLLVILLVLPVFSALAEPAPYYITVDIANQIVTVYDSQNKSESGIVRQMICSTGVENTTPTGLYVLPQKKYSNERTEWYYFTEYEVWAKYATRIRGNYLFHSTLYVDRGAAVPTWASNHSLGSKASHGCIRLREEDAKWIALNCMPGTIICIYDNNMRDEDLRKRLKNTSYIAAEMDRSEYMSGIAPIPMATSGRNSVKEIQEALNAAGFDCGKVDGLYGKITKAALHKWQAGNGFEEGDTLTTEQSRILLKEKVEKSEKAKSESAYSLPALSYTLKYGSQMNGVGALRSALRTLGYEINDKEGFYGYDTAAAVRRFQSKHGLKATGRADIETFAAIVGETTNDVYPHPYYDKGSPADEVTALQEKLIALGYTLTADGDYGPETRNAVSKWQKANRFDDTGHLTFDEAEILLTEKLPGEEEEEPVKPESTAEPEVKEPEEKEETPSDDIPEDVNGREIGARARVTMSKSDFFVNVRAAAEPEAEVLGKLQDGTIVRVLGEEGDWTQIEGGGLKGYVASEYLKTMTEDN